MLKFFEIEGRFPEFIEEFPQPAVEYVAGLVKVPAVELVKYDLAGAKRHRKQIREALGFRPSTVADEERQREPEDAGRPPAPAPRGAVPAPVPLALIPGRVDAFGRPAR